MPVDNAVAGGAPRLSWGLVCEPAPGEPDPLVGGAAGAAVGLTGPDFIAAARLAKNPLSVDMSRATVMSTSIPVLSRRKFSPANPIIPIMPMAAARAVNADTGAPVVFLPVKSPASVLPRSA